MAGEAPRETVRDIPLDAFDTAALARDRSGLDGAALIELRRSIAVSGLRLPIEVFPLAEPRGPCAWGLVSGYRRLLAFREQLAATGDARFAAIPAFVREPAGTAAALAALVAENEVRAAVSAFGRGRIAVAARDRGVFGTVEEAVERLYPHATSQKRTRLRALARLAEAMEGALAAPDALSERLALRLAHAVQAGHGARLRAAVAGLDDAAAQWRALLPLLAAAERTPDERPAAAARRAPRTRRAPPRLVVRRERCRDGVVLRITGPDATSALMDAAMAAIERMFGPA